MNLRWHGVVAGCLGILPAALGAQVGGNLAAPPPVDVQLQITTGENGPVLSPTEIELVTGEYYRLNVTADGRADWRLEVDALLENSHLRLLTIAGIEVHLQSMGFRGIEFDTEGTAQFSFVPIRPGTYEFTVGTPPPPTPRPGGGPDDARRAVGRFVVR
ncbi:MAG: hypothetical protein FJ207_14700 [Gemmatimonadetes bacterium]|nr:hypothetical protein [Gemmatimonadota bacterium]